MTAPAVAFTAQQQNSQADNTKTNARDRNPAQPTADNGKNGQTDVQLAAHIRRDVVHDKSLSTYAHNVKIIATHGQVTLKGPVHSDAEKQTILGYAKKYAGDGNVTDQITVKGESK
jgi:osmotically-inducible protein OsmY